jgi:hypothetical protein
MAKRVTTEEFIARAKRLHGDRYDYSKTNYSNAQTKLTIICPEHGPFLQLPGNHLKPAGCPKCGTDSMAAQSRGHVASFIERARRVHDDRYDYSLVNYKNARSKVTIVCPDHGEFTQTPDAHLNGQRCATCAGRPPVNTETFIKKATDVHGNTYDYSSVEYTNAHDPVTIVCRLHGAFKQKPDNHLSGKGCAKCSGNFLRSTEEFVAEARSIHGNTFDYSEAIYLGRNSILKIVCPDHGLIETRARDHLRSGGGCPGCAAYGFDQTQTAILYYLRIERFNERPLYKIGITNRSVQERFDNTEDRDRIVVIRTWNYDSGRAAFEREKELLKAHRSSRYDGPDVLVNGNTELFTRDVLELDSSSN